MLEAVAMMRRGMRQDHIASQPQSVGPGQTDNSAAPLDENSVLSKRAHYISQRFKGQNTKHGGSYEDCGGGLQRRLHLRLQGSRF